MADGRWDLGALVKRESREQERTGPGRPIQIQSIEVIDGRISLQDPLDFGAAHVPTDFESLNASFSFAYFPVRWTLVFDRVSWIGHAPDLSVNPLSGTLGRGPGGWFFENFSVRTARSAFTLDGRVNNADKPTVARPERARAAVRVSGMGRRHPRPEEHRGRRLVRHVAQRAGQRAGNRPPVHRHRRFDQGTADARHLASPAGTRPAPSTSGG